MKQLNEATMTDLIHILFENTGLIPADFLKYINGTRDTLSCNGECGSDCAKENKTVNTSSKSLTRWLQGGELSATSLCIPLAKTIFNKVGAARNGKFALSFLLDKLKDRDFDIQPYNTSSIPEGTDENSHCLRLYKEIVETLVSYAFASKNLTKVHTKKQPSESLVVEDTPAPEEHTFKSKHGVYICARHEDWALAGRIHDYLDRRGYQPFLNELSIHQDGSDKLICHTPVFICLLTTPPEEGEQIYKEIKTAIDSDRKIFLFIEQDVDFTTLPPEIKAVNNCTRFKIERTNFSSVMQKVCEEIEKQKESLLPFLDWRKTAHTRRNVYLTSRKTIQNEIAMPENTYGASLIQSIQNGGNYTGEIPISGIRIACYSANILFAPSRTIVDKASFDGGTLSRVFSRLLEDPDFTLEVIVTAPDSPCANDAINAGKLGNSARRVHPEAVFLSAYNKILTLIESDTVFREAYTTGRFQFFLAENVLPYALFQVQYKGGMETNDYIKVDLYSEGLDSNSDRRSMLIFKNDDSENYDFFNRNYDAIRKAAKPCEEVDPDTREKWNNDWNNLNRG